MPGDVTWTAQEVKERTGRTVQREGKPVKSIAAAAEAYIYDPNKIWLDADGTVHATIFGQAKSCSRESLNVFIGSKASPLTRASRQNISDAIEQKGVYRVSRAAEATMTVGGSESEAESAAGTDCLIIRKHKPFEDEVEVTSMNKDAYRQKFPHLGKDGGETSKALANSHFADIGLAEKAINAKPKSETKTGPVTRASGLLVRSNEFGYWGALFRYMEKKPSEQNLYFAFNYANDERTDPFLDGVYVDGALLGIKRELWAREKMSELLGELGQNLGKVEKNAACREYINLKLLDCPDPLPDLPRVVQVPLCATSMITSSDDKVISAHGKPSTVILYDKCGTPRHVITSDHPAKKLKVAYAVMRVGTEFGSKEMFEIKVPLPRLQVPRPTPNHVRTLQSANLEFDERNRTVRFSTKWKYMHQDDRDARRLPNQPSHTDELPLRNQDACRKAFESELVDNGTTVTAAAGTEFAPYVCHQLTKADLPPPEPGMQVRKGRGKGGNTSLYF